MLFVQKRLGIGLVGPRAKRERHSINRQPIGKRKFVAQLHVDLNGKTLILPIRKTRELAKIDQVKSSSERQVKARPFLRPALACLCGFAAQMSAGERVDLIFVNGNLYTVNEGQPHAEAVAVKNERIVFVGSNDDAKKFHATQVIDLQGKTVVPGMTDSHCHIFEIGEREMKLNLEGTNSLEDFLAKVKERVANTEGGKWVTGRGWIETFWKPPQFPTRADLDKIAPKNPVYLTRADGHASVANTAALKIAKIDKNMPDPFGGQILKTNGEPNGMLLDNAQDIVEKNIPKPSEAERGQALLTGIEHEIKLGWCEIQNAGSHKEDIDLMKKVYGEREAKI